MKKREAPDIIYPTLKLYGAMINHFFNLRLHLPLWLCTKSYERALRHTRKHYIKNNGFAPSPLKKNIFTAVTKYEIHFNATSSTAVQNFLRPQHDPCAVHFRKKLMQWIIAFLRYWQYEYKWYNAFKYQNYTRVWSS